MASVSASMARAKQDRANSQQMKDENMCQMMRDELKKKEALREAHAHAQDIAKKHAREAEGEQRVQKELERLHIRDHAAEIVERRRAIALEKGREAQRQLVKSRNPNWWPQELRVAPQWRPPDARTVAASADRLSEIKAMLAAGQKLDAADESDAAAIMELHEMWAANAAQAQQN